MKEIKLLSGELNKLIRIVENYKLYVADDRKLTDYYKELEFKNIDLVYRRLIGYSPINDVALNRNDDLCLFGLNE